MPPPNSRPDWHPHTLLLPICSEWPQFLVPGRTASCPGHHTEQQPSSESGQKTEARSLVLLQLLAPGPLVEGEAALVPALPAPPPFSPGGLAPELWTLHLCSEVSSLVAVAGQGSWSLWRLCFW